jgi:hypothetical protein
LAQPSLVQSLVGPDVIALLTHLDNGRMLFELVLISH